MENLRKAIGKLRFFHGILWNFTGLIKHGWKIPELNGGVNRKIIDKWSIFQHAMFDCRRVNVSTWCTCFAPSTILLATSNHGNFEGKTSVRQHAKHSISIWDFFYAYHTIRKMPGISGDSYQVSFKLTCSWGSLRVLSCVAPKSQKSVETIWTSHYRTG